MKLTKEILRQIIKEEIENVDEIGGITSGNPTGRLGRQPRRTRADAPEPESPTAAAGGETTMEIGQVEDIKSRLDALIAQSGNQLVGKMSMLLKMIDAELAKQGHGTKGEFMKQRGTTSQRRTRARQVATKGKGSGAGLGLSEGDSE